MKENQLISKQKKSKQTVRKDKSLFKFRNKFVFLILLGFYFSQWTTLGVCYDVCDFTRNKIYITIIKTS